MFVLDGRFMSEDVLDGDETEEATFLDDQDDSGAEGERGGRRVS